MCLNIVCKLLEVGCPVTGDKLAKVVTKVVETEKGFRLTEIQQH